MSATPERRVLCVRVVPEIGDTIRIALYPENLVMSDGIVYNSSDFFDISNISGSTGTASNIVEISSIFDADEITELQIKERIWENSNVYVFATDWSNPVEDEEEIGLFTIGEIFVEDNTYKVEINDAFEKLNQDFLPSNEYNCTKTFADHHIDGQDINQPPLTECGIDHNTVIVTGTITHVIDAQTFRDDTRAEAADYFGNGEFIFTDGVNNNLHRRIVATYDADGTFHLNYPYEQLPSVGASYTAMAGCRFRYEEDCGTKWSNQVNFNGKRFAPTAATISQIGGQE